MFYVRSFYYLFILFFYYSCNEYNKEEEIIDYSYQKFTLDEYGDVLSTEFNIDDFSSAQTCEQCHPNHYLEWSQSMHAYSMKDPKFFSVLNNL